MATWLCHLRVIAGFELPKTDLFSQIDPFVVVIFDGEEVGVTRAKQDNPNPQWNEDFYFEAPEDDDGKLLGTLQLDLYDEDVTTNKLIASVFLDLQQHSTQCTSDEAFFTPIALPLVFGNDKRSQKRAKSSRNARISFQLVGLGKPYSTYVEELQEHPGLIADDNHKTFLVPVPDSQETLYAGMAFGPREASIILCCTSDPKSMPTVSYDFACRGQHSSKVQRTVYKKARKFMGIKVFSELRALNIPLGTSLAKVKIQEVRRRMLDTLDPADCLASNAFQIGMPFMAACKVLSKQGAIVDATNQRIFLKLDQRSPPSHLLLLDYAEHEPVSTPGPSPSASGAPSRPALNRTTSSASSANGRAPAPASQGTCHPALRVCATPASGKASALMLEYLSSAAVMRSVVETWRKPTSAFSPPAPGQPSIEVTRCVDLCGAFGEDAINTCKLGVFSIEEGNEEVPSWKLSSVFRVPPPELPEGEEAAGGEGAGGGKRRSGSAGVGNAVAGVGARSMSALRGAGTKLSGFFAACFGTAGSPPPFDEFDAYGNPRDERGDSGSAHGSRSDRAPTRGNSAGGGIASSGKYNAAPSAGGSAGRVAAKYRAGTLSGPLPTPSSRSDMGGDDSSAAGARPRAGAGSRRISALPSNASRSGVGAGPQMRGIGSRSSGGPPSVASSGWHSSLASERRRAGAAA